jgi:hypothetical protein
MKHRTGELLATAVAVVVTVCAMATPASAGTPADPVAVHAMDIASAEVGNVLANASDPNITCSDPKVTGMVVTPNRDFGVVLVRGNDVAVAEGECISLTNRSFSIDLTVTVERWDEDVNDYSPICSASGSAANVRGTGVAAVPAEALCTYAYPKGSLAPVHRAHAILTNSLNDTVRESYSALIWPGGEAAA